MTKGCTRCRRVLEPGEFNYKNRATGRLQSHCRDCSRELIRDHYKRNKAYYVAKAMARHPEERRLLLSRMLEYLRGHPCVDCGEGDPVVLDFDHLDASQKRSNVG